jgi:hypothetical protein
MKILMIFVVTVLVSACSVQGSNPGTNNSPPPTATATPTQYYVPVVTSQTSANGIVGYGFDDPLEVHFTLNGVTQTTTTTTVANVVAKAYSDSACKTLASGTLTYSSSVAANQFILNNIMYSSAQDIYIGFSGTINGKSVSSGCSNLINVMSGAPTNFSVVSGDNQSTTVGGNLPAPIKFNIVDSNNNPVQNAKVNIGSQYSLASDSSGNANLAYNVGQASGTMTEAVDLVFNGTDLDQVDITVTAIALTGTTMSLGSVQPMTVVIAAQGGVTDPYYLMALDQYGNVVYPSNWTFSFASFSDPNCTVSGLTIANEDDFTNSAINANDSSTWFKEAIFSFNDPGNVYLGFSLLDNQSHVVSKACSNLLTVTPN